MNDARSDAGWRGLGLEPLDTFVEARARAGLSARGLGLRRAAEGLGDRLREGPKAVRIEALALDRRPCTTRAACDGAWKTSARETTLTWRALYLELSIGGAQRRVLVDPVEPGAWRGTPWGGRPRRGAGDAGTRIEDALAGLGVSPDTIDLVLLSHLRGQDLRRLVGTARGDGLRGPLPGVFGRARWLVDHAAWAARTRPHDAERAYWSRDGLQGVEAVEACRADLSLGAGAAWVSSPGWSEGQRTLFVNTAQGVMAWSAHGVSRGCWSPYHARLPGLRARVRSVDAECIPRGDGLCRVSALDGMAMERAATSRCPDAPEMHLVWPQQVLDGDG
jgi:hypothetical protein